VKCLDGVVAFYHVCSYANRKLQGLAWAVQLFPMMV
jgi:hypothetical protein